MRSTWKSARAAAALVAALCLSVAACGSPAGGTSGSAGAPDTIRIGVTPDQLGGTYDPVTVTMSGPIDQRAVYEPLFAPDSSIEVGGFEPVLATGYERSADWKTVTLTLRDDVTFVDGAKLTAAGLKTYLDGMAAVEGWWFTPFWDLSTPTLTAVDETTLEITSATPMPLSFRRFLHMLFTQVAIASPNVLDDLEAAATEPLGSGPYVVESSTPEVGATLVRNEDHWDQDAYPFDTIELSVFADDVAAHNALNAKQIDAAQLSIPLADQAEKQGFTLNVESTAGRTYMLYVADRNGTTNPALADPRVRQAMALAFDRPVINEAVDLGYGVVTSQPFIESQPEYVDGGDERYGYDPERARQLLAEAGYPDGFDLEILSTTFRGEDAPQPVVAQYLGDIGIRVTFETLETSDFFDAAINSTAYPVVMYSEYFFNILPVFIAPDATFNPFKVQDPEVDDRWAVVQSGPDDAAARASAELGEYVVDQSLLIVYKATKNIWATAPGFAVPFDVFVPQVSDFAYTG